MDLLLPTEDKVPRVIAGRWHVLIRHAPQYCGLVGNFPSFYRVYEVIWWTKDIRQGLTDRPANGIGLNPSRLPVDYFPPEMPSNMILVFLGFSTSILELTKSHKIAATLELNWS